MNDDRTVRLDEESRVVPDAATVDDAGSLALEFDAPVEASDEAFVEAASEPEFDVPEPDIDSQPALRASARDPAFCAPTLDDLDFDAEPVAAPSVTDILEFDTEPVATPSVTDILEFDAEPVATPSVTDTLEFDADPAAASSAADDLEFDAEPAATSSDADPLEFDADAGATAALSVDLEFDVDPPAESDGPDRSGLDTDSEATVSGAASSAAADLHFDGDTAAGAAPPSQSPTADGPVDPESLPPEDAATKVPDDDEGAPLGGMIAEMLALLVEELPAVRATVKASLARLARTGADPEARGEALRDCVDALHRFAEAAEAGGFGGIRTVFAHLEANLVTLSTQPDVFAAVAGLSESCLACVAAYLGAPSSPRTIATLASSCAAGGWPVPIALSVDALGRVLGGVATMKVVRDGPTRAERAGADDVSLALPEDVNRELLDGLLLELPGHTEAFTAAVQRLSGGGALEDVVAAQRIAHTLKGAGNTVGVRGIAVLTHTLEDILLALSKNGRLPTPAIMESLVTAADCLEAMSESLVSGTAPPSDSVDVLQTLLDWANRIDREGLPDADASAPAAPGPVASAAAATAGADVKAEEAAAAVPMIRLPATVVDDLLRLVGETIIMTGQIRERLVRAQHQTQAMRGQFELLRQLGADLGEFVDVTDFEAHHALASADAEFDALEMDRYSELHTYGRRMVEAATDASEMGGDLLGQFGALREMLQGQERLNRETQEAVMRTRMVHVKEVFPRLQRNVRQTCRLTGKLAELVLVGGDTLVDSEVLSTVVDALMHLLRNAVDHGIEDPARRAAASKPEAGTVRLEFSRQGNSIVARCEDDGAGLDYAAIYATALRHGLIDASESVSQEELKRFVMQANFSTRSSATQTSGRGIGLEAVHACVAAMGGLVSIDSRPGQGCTVELRIPVSLVSSHALLVRVGERTIAVSDRGVSQVLHPSAGSAESARGAALFRVGEEAYPVRTLESLLGAGRDTHAHGARTRPMLLVRHPDGVSAVEVDAVLETRDLVVKPFGRYVGKLRGMLGATILGDGGVTPVLDLPELLRSPVTGLDATQTTLRGLSLSAKKLPVALVVDDSLSARRSLAQFMGDAGFDVRTARDGVEAAELLVDVKPDILLVDLEMPRMNGMELAAHVRATASLAAVPVIMVTSRSTEKHRREAELAGVNVYMSKPFSEDVLLDHLRALVGI